jgi:hypothetical protein
MKRPSVEKAGKVLFAAMRETAEAGDRDGFVLVLRAWDLDEKATNAALQAWDEKRREIQRGDSDPRGFSR